MMPVLSSQPGLEDSTVGGLYQRYWLVLLTAIRQSVASQEDAEDLLLDVFLAAIENGALPGMSAQHQEAWLRRVAYNKCMDFHRRAARRPTVPIESYAETLYDDEDLSPEHRALHREELSQLREHFASLPAAQQELLRLRFADDLLCSQIAVRLHKGEGAIRMTISRTLNRLRDIYTKRGRKTAMSSRDEQEQAFQADTLDEKLARLTRNTSSSADARLVHDLHAISHEYTRSGEHVWQRLAERLAQQETTPTVPRPVISNSTRHIERSIYMQTQTPESNTLPSRQDRPPGRAGRVFALVAAVLVAVALVGSLAAVFQLARHKPSGQTGGTHQQSPTPGQIVYSSPRENGAVGSLAWSADGQRVAAVGSQTQIWDATTGQHQVTVHFARAGEDVYGSPAWSPTSDLLAIPTNYEVAIVDGQTGHVVKSYTESSTTPTASIAPANSTGQTYLSSLFPAGYGTLPDFPALAWSPNGTQVVFAVFFGPTSGSEVQIWNPQTGQPALTLAVESHFHINALSWSPDGEYIAANMQNMAATGDATRVVVWSVATHQVVFQKSGNLSLNYGAHWQPGSHNLAFITPLPASKNAVKPVPGLEIWNVTTRQLVKSIAGLNVSTWAWSPDGKEIAYAYSYSDGSASPAAVAAVLDVNSGQTVYPYKVSSGTIGALAWSPNGNYIVTSDNMLQDTTPTLQQSYVVQVWVA